MEHIDVAFIEGVARENRTEWETSDTNAWWLILDACEALGFLGIES